MTEKENSRRLIEAGFPCHQVGAETQRERGASSALPPLYYLHVWWARRPLTPSRAAVLGSILPADTDPDWFLKELGIEKKVIRINGELWTLNLKDNSILKRVYKESNGVEYLLVDKLVLDRLEAENERRKQNALFINEALEKDPAGIGVAFLKKWLGECVLIPSPYPNLGAKLKISTVTADPAWAKERISWEKAHNIRTNEDKYGYDRAFYKMPSFSAGGGIKLLDLTAGGGSIPFEALRLGCEVVANELNPVASVILSATLEYPATYGDEILPFIEKYFQIMRDSMVQKIQHLFPASCIPQEEKVLLERHLQKYPNLVCEYLQEELYVFLFAREIKCSFCGGDLPLLNTCWLSKTETDPWGVEIVADQKTKGGSVHFRTYRVKGNKGPSGEDPGKWTVSDAIGKCIHKDCEQNIDAEEIKRQARGESEHGRWKDRLYAVAAVRYQPKLDKNGQIQRFKTGEKAGEIKTEKIRFFRPPNERDLAALEEAERMLKENWTRWEDAGLIPTENFPQGNDMRPVLYGMSRWCDLFTPRQLLGHLFLIEELNRLKPQILKELGHEKGKAVVTYLQFAIDKGLDYNSRQTRWIPQRGQVSGTFGRHDFSLKWTFGEMVFTGPNSGAAWGLSQILDAYKGIAELLEPVKQATQGKPPLTLIHGTAAAMPQVPDSSVDVICFDPPYYNNVQYAELSDYFYVWQKRTLRDLYPDLFHRRLTNKEEEAVANPDRDGGEKGAKASYERMMGEIFREARRVLKDEGLMTMMFTHKSQEAWETLTRALIECGWVISSTIPIESEFLNSQHLMDNASAASSIFISCRKAIRGENQSPSSWKGFGGSGVQQKVQVAVEKGLEEIALLKLNPVDRMVASYGRALQALSENWPVLDGDEPVGPKRAMLEASRVVAEAQFREIAKGKLSLSDLSPEAAMAMLLFGVFGLSEFDYDDALSLSRSLNIALETKVGGYLANGRFIGINTQESVIESMMGMQQIAIWRN